MMSRMIIPCVVALAASIGPAFAAGCEASFRMSGVPMVSKLSYRASEDFARVKPDVALKRLSQAVAAEGFAGIRVNRSLGSIDAHQETSGSGRVQTLRVVARPKGGGTRVDIIFSLQVGQVAGENIVRQSLCSIVSAAGG